jgi:hypothetical protein
MYVSVLTFSNHLNNLYDNVTIHFTTSKYSNIHEKGEIICMKRTVKKCDFCVKINE